MIRLLVIICTAACLSMWLYTTYELTAYENGFVKWDKPGIRLDIRVKEHFFWFDIYW